MVASAEFRRIASLPRRRLEPCPFFAAELTAYYRVDGGTMRLWPIQAAALLEAYEQNGLLAPMGVGHGKTLVTLLLPEALDSACAVLLVPPQLKKQLSHEIEHLYSKHFRMHPNLHIVAYSELSQAKNTDLLSRLKPDLVIADEAHSLKNPKAARTKRFLRYFKEHPGARFCGLSGTMTQKSLRDFAHLSELALKKNSPVPARFHELMEWANALDDDPQERYAPGALLEFCSPGESPRSGFRRRLVDTAGVVATEESSIGTSLIFRYKNIAVPGSVQKHIDAFKKTWALEGKEVESATEYATTLKQLSLGFYYIWDWPNGEVNRDWLYARNEWARFCRDALSRSIEGYDSPLLLARACARRDPKFAHGFDAWDRWAEAKQTPPPPTKAVWVDPYVADVVKQWTRSNQGIVWYQFRALEEILPLPCYGQGRDASFAPEDTIACSMQAQGTGKNLQRYNANLFTSWPGSAKTLEQVVGRTHRPGQKNDEVTVDWVCFGPHSFASYDSCYRNALYVQETNGQKQKLLYATKINFPALDID